MRTDRRTDMTKVIVAFRSFPNALNKNITCSFPRSACLTRLAKKQARGDGLVYSSITPVNHQPKLPSGSFSGVTQWTAPPYSHHPAPEHVWVYPCIRLCHKMHERLGFLVPRGRWGSGAWDCVVSSALEVCRFA